MNDTQQTTYPVFRAGLKKDEVLTTVKPGTLVAVFDTETTGLAPEKSDRIIEFAGILWVIQEDYSLKRLRDIQIYIKPPFEVSEEVVNLTGITNEFLADKPDETEVVDEIRAFLRQADVTCGHNVSFDHRFIKTTMERNRRAVPVSDTLDTWALARDLIEPNSVENNKLGTLVSALGLDEGLQFHSAIDDVEATSLLLQTFLQQYVKQSDEEVIELMTVTVTGVQYWARHDMERIYINTDKGSMYFDAKTGYFGAKDIDTTRVDRAQIERDAMALIGVNTVDDLLLFRGKK